MPDTVVEELSDLRTNAKYTAQDAYRKWATNVVMTAASQLSRY